ncbi:aldehyde dehydrogenase (NAD+) [Paenibacillus sp. RU4T]|uniref:aldehyde dehydrogenase family protein n=1 Tax=unclassified Paenibacillus TaxID=185978 RepID=UPI0009569B76|nr:MULTISPECIES: aldehyde dehydrogenase family protein [unclassified Paenibacillus]SIR07704.1 aldehyde dehydrogenase (NAD+) [Paenibacillus sp. RU4X]SIR28318.1 aldehyde dehydrogenase (NAD+) [Paenibacillus sp. RU4T]
MDSATEAEIKTVFRLQKQNRHSMRDTSAEQRIARLIRFKEAILARQDQLIEAIRTDVRKPRSEVERVEVTGTFASIDHMIAHLKEWMKPETVPSALNPKARGQLVYEPKGVCLILGPWNYPFLLTAVPLATAIAAGNCAMVKLSDFTPETSRAAASIIREAFDEKEAAVFEGEVEVATELLEQPFDHIFFTGSTPVGKIVMTAAAKHLASVTLELGGKSPTLLGPGCDVKDAARKIARGKFMNAGQTCIAPDYMLVQAGQQDEFAAALEAVVRSGYADGQGVLDKRKLAQIVNKRNFDRIKSLYDDAVAKGAETVFGGQFDEDDRTVHPTVLKNVSADMKIMQEEIFGPILPILTYGAIEEAIHVVNERDKPLALYVFSDDKELVDKVLQGTTSGNVAVNDVVVHFSEPNLPFGGVNQSGIGSYHGIYGFREFSHRKGIYFQA